MFILPYSSPTSVHATTGERTPATAKDCAGGAPVTVLNIRMSSDKHVYAVTLMYLAHLTDDSWRAANSSAAAAAADGTGLRAQQCLLARRPGSSSACSCNLQDSKTAVHGLRPAGQWHRSPTCSVPLLLY